ncbi:MAG: arginine repressor, partial [Clostridiales bacterium]|nr:arginine repressor [Clostridiales bacterium]
MKRKRLDLIRKLIEKYSISTQEELLRRLEENGFEVTQATISRDINELRIIKMMGSNGQYRYVTSNTDSDELVSKFNAIFGQSVISADYAG